jgi:hypothetical protein
MELQVNTDKRMLRNEFPYDPSGCIEIIVLGLNP